MPTHGREVYVRFLKPLSSRTQPSEDEVGARLLAFAGQWREVTDDSWVLDGIAQGIKLDFEALPTQFVIPPPCFNVKRNGKNLRQGGGGLDKETGDH